MLLERVAERQREQYTAAIRAAVDMFPARSQGRERMVASLAKTCSDRSLLANAIDVNQRYIANAASPAREWQRKSSQSHVSSKDGREGVSYTHIMKAEGKQLFTWVLSEASMKSGQKCRKKGVTLYTEQPIYAFYDKYRTEFFSLCLAEAKPKPEYASGSPPASVSSEHEANLWTAVWMSRQEGFDIFNYTAELQAEYLRERLTRG